MEEKKKTNANHIQMNVAKKENEQTGKLTYEKLNELCIELSEQNQQMRKYIQNLRTQIEEYINNNSLQRLGYLFEVLKYKDQFSSDFIIYCVDEIKEALVIPENTEQKNQEKKG